MTARFGLGLTPGEAMRSTFGSEAASLPGSHNLSGIANEAVDALIEKALVADTREELTFICRAIDRILRSGHYWVPMWNKPNHLVAYWDVFGRPERGPKIRYGRCLDLVVRRGKSQAHPLRRPLKGIGCLRVKNGIVLLRFLAPYNARRSKRWRPDKHCGTLWGGISMIERILIVLKISAVARKFITILNAILRDRRSWQQISA